MVASKRESIEPILNEHEDLLPRVHAVERHLERLEEFASRMGFTEMTLESLSALERVVAALEPLVLEHFTREESSPLYTTFLEERPDCAIEVARLRGEHEAIRHQLVSLLRSAARADLSESVSAAIEQGWELVRTIRAHERAEHALLAGGPAAVPIG